MVAPALAGGVEGFERSACRGSRVKDQGEGMSSVSPGQFGGGNSMPKNSKLGLSALIWGLAVGSCSSSSSFAWADQFAIVLDEHGHETYINTGPPTDRFSYWNRKNSRGKGGAVPSLPPPEINHLVEKTAGRFQIDPKLVQAIIEVESEYNPKAVSRKGAMGLMQLVPSTANRFGVSDPFDPRQNIEGGVSYLKYLLSLYGGDIALSLAAYNAGEHAVERFGGVPSFRETESYIRKVKTRYQFGPAKTLAKPNPKEPRKFPIVRYVDAQGVVHFTNVE